MSDVESSRDYGPGEGGPSDVAGQPDTAGDAPNVPAESLAAVEYYQPPRLGIIHFLAWITATALLLKFYTATEIAFGSSARMPDWLDAFRDALNAANQILLGAVLVGAGSLALAIGRRACGRLQPGHWILVAEGVEGLLRLGFNVSLVWDRMVATEDRYVLTAAGVSLITAAIYLAASFTPGTETRWRRVLRTFFAIGAIRCLPLLLFLFCGISRTCFPLLCWVGGVAIAWAVFIDVRRGSTRDWLHRLGVGIVIVDMFFDTAWYVWNHVAMRYL